MKTHLFAFLAFTMLAGPALAQAPSPQPDQQAPGASPAPMTPMPQTTPRPQQPQAGAMMCGMMQPGQQAQGAGGCSCCSGMMGAQPQRQGMMGGMQMGQAPAAPPAGGQAAPAPMDHSRMAQMQHGPAAGAGGGHAGHGAPSSPSQASAPAMDQGAMQRMMQDMSPAPNDPASTKAFKAADMKMMHDMAVPYTGDPDVDLRTKMIPHHQGAIDMAKVALAHAKDPETKRMAQKIIDDQEREVAEMRDWLSKRGK